MACILNAKCNKSDKCQDQSPGLLPPECLIRQETVLHIVHLHPGVKMGSPPKCLDYPCNR